VTNIISEEDAAILGIVAHGKAKELDQSIFRTEWMDGDIGRQLVSACVVLARDGKDVNAIAAIAKAKLSVPGLVPEVIKIFKNGFGAADLQDAIQHTYQNYVNRQVEQMSEEMQRLSHSEPQNVTKWLPRFGISMANILHAGDSYDPRPSKHAEKPLPTVFAKSLIGGPAPNGTMNDLLRGGYKTSFFMLYAGVTSHGKSLTLRSHAADLILQKFRVAVVITENTETTFSAEVGAALAGVDFESEVSTKVFKANEYESAADRKSRYRQCLQYADEYLLVYGPKWYSDSQLERIVRWEHPEALIIDYFMKKSGMLRKATNAQDEVGDWADYLLEFAKTTGLWICSAGQMSKDASKKFVKTGSTDDVIVYGTARPEYASDEFVPVRRHPKLKNTADFHVKKDRLGNRLDTTHSIPLDPIRRILQINRLLAQNTTSPDSDPL